jgi:putative Mn2+ efflux pump MntP
LDAPNWDASNLPVEEEHEQNPLELANPALGSGTQQAFYKTVLEWSASLGKVIEMWVGREMIVQRAKANANVGVSPAAKADAQKVAADIAQLEKDLG